MSGLMLAYATLKRGTGFLDAGLCAPGRARPRPIAGPHSARVIGNALRELDRFLNILIGEAARAGGLSMHDGEYNTANKLRAFRRAVRDEDADHERLRAIGRTRECLFHCAGIVRRPDRPGGALMTTGWLEAWGDGTRLRRVALGESLMVSAGDLAELCRYYDGIARTLLAHAGQSPVTDREPGHAVLAAVAR